MYTTYHVNRKNTLARLLFTVAFVCFVIGGFIILAGISNLLLEHFIVGGTLVLLGLVILLIADSILSRRPELYYTIYVDDDSLTVKFSEDDQWEASRNYSIVLEGRKIILYDHAESDNIVSLDYDRKVLRFLEKSRVRNF